MSGSHGDVTRVGPQTDILGESPVWYTRDQALYWADIRQPAIRRYDHVSGRVDSWPMPDLVGSLVVADDGQLLVALPGMIALFDPATGALTPFAEPDRVAPALRFNDGKCDRQGRFWVGSMNNVTREPVGVLYRLDASARMQAVQSGLCIPNSLAWSPDGRTMYFADSLQRTILAYPFDVCSGAVGEPRAFAHTTEPAIPDGATVDADGYLWSAEYDGWRITRYRSDGRVDRVIELPVQRPTSCAFGGPNLDILFITTATQRLSAAELSAQPLAGALLAIDVGVRGVAEPRFALARS